MANEIVQFPADSGPEPTSFTLAIPPGWEQSTTMGADLALLEPAAQGSFRSTVLVSCRRLTTPVPVVEIEKRVRKTIEQLPELAVAFTSDVSVDGLPGFVAEYSFVKEPEGVTVAQVQLNLLALVGDGGVDLITLTGSVGPIEPATSLETVRSIITSLELVKRS